MWETVDAELSRLDREAPTRNLSDADSVIRERPQLAGALAELVSLGPHPGQSGVVISHGSRVVAGEVFATPELLAGQWPMIVKAALLDAPAEPRGRPSASRALRLLRRTASATGSQVDGVGLGREHHVRVGRVVAQILAWEGLVVHASSFVLAA